jgi:hypothetical protein
MDKRWIAALITVGIVAAAIVALLFSVSIVG